MSTIPGYTLERYVMWDLDLIVGDDRGANLSLSLVEAMGQPTRRIRITQAQFREILALYEPFRHAVECALNSYDEDESGSWRDYAGFVMKDLIPTAVRDQARRMYVEQKTRAASLGTREENNSQ